MTSLLDYLQNRRSNLSLTLQEPGPSDGQVRTMVQIASRVPDHGKLAPWRFELWTPAYRQKLQHQLGALVDEQKPAAAKMQAGTDKLSHAPCIIAAISTASEHENIPVWEQHLSAGASCMLLLEAANSLGFGAQWLTAWYVYDRRAVPILGLAEGERIAGIIHIGTADAKPADRPRPDLDAIFSIRESD